MGVSRSRLDRVLAPVLAPMYQGKSWRACHELLCKSWDHVIGEVGLIGMFPLTNHDHSPSALKEKASPISAYLAAAVEGFRETGFEATTRNRAAPGVRNRLDRRTSANCLIEIYALRSIGP